MQQEKLPPQDMIVRLRAQGWTEADIAEAYGVTLEEYRRVIFERVITEGVHGGNQD